jgi:hypothetical protein
MQVTRHPNGVWSAVGSVPIGAGLFTVREIFDETPLRREAVRRVSQVVGPELKAKCGATPDGRIVQNDMFWSMIKMANRTADLMVNKAAREVLMQRLAGAIRRATATASSIYKLHAPPPHMSLAAPAIGAHQPVEAVISVLANMMRGDERARQQILEMSTRVSNDARSRGMVQAIMERASTMPQVASQLRALYVQYSMPKMVTVLDRRVVLTQSRAQAR